MSDASVTLRLKGIDDFFHQPHIDPRSEWFGHYSLTSGLEHVVERVAGSPWTVERDLAESVKTGIGRYCGSRLRTVDHAAPGDRSRGWLMLAFSVSVFAFDWVAQQFASRQETLLGVTSEGLSIAAWVMLWHPLEHLLFNGGDHRLDGRVLRTVRDHCSVTIAAMQKSARPSEARVAARRGRCYPAGEPRTPGRRPRESPRRHHGCGRRRGKASAGRASRNSQATGTRPDGPLEQTGMSRVHCGQGDGDIALSVDV